MGEASYVQPSFLGGEVSKLAQGRLDRPDYRTLMNVCLNGLPSETGAWVRRPGTKCLAVSRGGKAARGQSFDFKTGSPYTIEFTDAVVRFFTSNQLAMTNDQQVVSAISAANPAEVTTTANHGWSTDNTVYFNSLGINNPLLHNRPFLLTSTAANKFTLRDAVTGANIDGSTLGAFVSGKVTRVLELASPYVGGAWAAVRVIKADIPLPAGTTPGAVLLHAATKPYLLQVATAPTATAFATFTLAPAVFKDGPYFDPVRGGTLATPSAVVGVITLTLAFNAYSAAVAYSIGDYVTSGGVNYKSLVDANVGSAPPSANWVAVSASDAIGPNGFVGTDVGRMVRLFSEPPMWDVATSYAKDAVVAFGGSGLSHTGATYWKSLVAANVGNTPGLDITKWALFPAGAIWTWGRITSLANIIDRALAGSVNIGDMTLGGGLADSFNGIFSEVFSTCSRARINGFFVFTGDQFTLNCYVGKNYSGAAAQKIVQAVFYPSSDRGFTEVDVGGGPLSVATTTVQLNLRGKATAPGSPSDGTLIGTTGPIPNTSSPVTIASTDQVTAWNYVWVEIVIVATARQSGVWIAEVYSAEVSFFNPPGTGASAVQVQIVGDALLYTNAVRTWRLGVFSDTTGWPTCGTWHEGRLLLSGVVANRFDGSKSNDPFNFAPTETDGTVTASSAIGYTFNAPDVNTILWMEPDQQGLLCGTAGGEWLVQASALNQPLTPTSIQAHRTMKHKCANIEPRRTGLTLCAVQAGKRSVLEFFPDVYSGKFAADNLAEDAKHLTKGNVAELAFTHEVTPIIWVRKEDGSLAGLTYRRKTLSSAQRAEIRGWHRHTLGSGRLVESISAGPSVGGLLDAITLVTNDAATRHIELMTDILDEGSTLAQAAYLDDAVTPTAFAVNAATGVTLFGLWPLNGKTCTAWLGGLDCGDYLVTNGQITVPFGDGVSGGTASGLFTGVFVATGVTAYGDVMFTGTMPALVGFSFASDGQIIRPQLPTESGARSGPAFGKTRRNHQYAVQLEGTQGVVVGTSFATGRLKPALFKRDGGRPYRVSEQFSGIWWDSIVDDSSYDGMICWRVSRPYICNIAAIGGFIQTQDK